MRGRRRDLRAKGGVLGREKRCIIVASMPFSAVPALVGIVLLLLVGLLAMLTEWRAPAARWFALFNVCLAATALTSGRRWEKHGVMRTILMMWRLRLAFFLGAEPAALASRYGYAPREP